MNYLLIKVKFEKYSSFVKCAIEKVWKGEKIPWIDLGSLEFAAIQWITETLCTVTLNH